MMRVKPEIETFAKILVVGCGGGGGSSVGRMVQSKMTGVGFIAVNTDAQALHTNIAPMKVHIGKNLTRGLGAGMNPEIGRQAAEEDKEEIQKVIKGSDLVFLTCGLGGGTGTGSIPIIAEVAREGGALVVGVVTKPFSFEGRRRMQVAQEGLETLRDHVDTLITIPNDRLLGIIDKKIPLLQAFHIVDEVLQQGVQGISDLITVPGIVNVDFADVKAVMKDAGSALMGIGKATGENRAIGAAKAAINSPLLERSVDGARGVLFNVCGGPDLTMSEVNEAAQIITESVDPDAKIIFGAVTDEDMKKDEIKITVVATGFDSEESRATTEHQGIISQQQPATETQQKTGFAVTQQQDDGDEPPPAMKNRVSFDSEVSTVDDNDDLDIPAFIRKKMK